MSNYEGWPTTRRYPRTLADAFKDDPDNSQWFYPPEKNISGENILMGMIALCLWVCIAYLLTVN